MLKEIVQWTFPEGMRFAIVEDGVLVIAPVAFTMHADDAKALATHLTSTYVKNDSLKYTVVAKYSFELEDLE